MPVLEGELSPTDQTLGKLEFDLHFDTDTKMFIRTNCEATFLFFSLFRWFSGFVSFILLFLCKHFNLDVLV